MSGIFLPADENLTEVPVHGLKPGMFVASLDRPWLETPFAMQGFYVGDEVDVQFIAKYCSYVFIDVKRKISAADLAKQPKQRHLADSTSFREEYAQASIDFESASQSMRRVFDQLEQHRKVDTQSIQEAVTPLIDSVFRNREALAALVRLKDKGDYFYSHSISTTVWAAVLGRYLGMDKETLIQLAMGTSMMDVGMTLINDSQIDKHAPLDDAGRVEVQRHVQAGLNMVAESGEVSNRVLNIIAAHHERHDGSGYPQGLSGNDIPPLARIAGLVDTYDAMISERPYATARSSFQAMQELHDLGDVHFQSSLVEQFMQTVGMFPTGSVVELNTGDVGVVVQQNPMRRLRPKIVLILDKKKNRRASLTVIDLCKYHDQQQMATVWITRELEAGAYGIRPDDYFL